MDIFKLYLFLFIHFYWQYSIHPSFFYPWDHIWVFTLWDIFFLKKILSVAFAHLKQEAKKKYDKETEKYCAVLEKHLSLSAKKKESHLHEVRCCSWSSSPSSGVLLNIRPSVFTFSVAGGQSGGQRAAALLRGLPGVRLQGAGGPGEEDVWFCGACEYFYQAELQLWPFYPVPHVPANVICLFSLFSVSHPASALFVIPAAAGLPPGPVHLLSPRLWAGKGLQPLQDWADHQHSECNRSRTHGRKGKHWFLDEILVLCSLGLVGMINLIFKDEFMCLRNTHIKAKHFACKLCTGALLCCWTGASLSDGKADRAHISSSSPVR